MRRRAALLLSAMVAALALSSGVALALNTIQCPQPEDPYYCYGTERDDRMLGTDGLNDMYARGGNDVLKGFRGNDGLRSDEGDDRLFGGAGDDYLDPGPGDDALNGGAGLNSYYFPDAEGDPWGHDTIAATSPDHGYDLLFYSSNGLTINLASSEERPEVTNASGTSTVDWSGDVVDNTYGTYGDDTIRGNDETNHIHAVLRSWWGYDPVGSDVVFAEGGDDFVWVRDYGPGKYGVYDDVVSKDARDYVDCGTGTDVVYYDEDDKVRNCEVEYPYDLPDDYQW